MESARINPKNPQGDNLLRPTCKSHHDGQSGSIFVGRHVCTVLELSTEGDADSEDDD